jgi:hypothetical protein
MEKDNIIILSLIILILAVGGIAGYLLIADDTADISTNKTINKTIENNTSTSPIEKDTNTEKNTYSEQSSSDNSYRSQNSYSSNNQENNQYHAGQAENFRTNGSLD